MTTNQETTTKYNRLNHCKFLIQYHLIWCPKFRYSVLGEVIEIALKEVLYTIGKRYEYEIKEMEVMPDHIHMFVSTKPTVAPTDVVRSLKAFRPLNFLKDFRN